MYDLRCFAAVAARLNFTRAADDLHLSTPALSRRIRDMERILNTQLFHRDTRHVALTPAGANLLPVAQKLLDQFEKLPAVVASDDQPRQTIICGVPTWLHPQLKDTLSRLREVYAERLTLIDQHCRSDQTIASMLRKDLTFGFVRPFTQNLALDSVVVHQEKMGAVLCKARYGSHTSIQLRELLALDYVTDRRDSDTEYRHQVDQVLESAGTLRRARVAPGDHAAGAAAIRTGNAFAIAPLSTTRIPGYNTAEYVCLPIGDFNFTLTTCMAWSKDLSENSRTARDVIDTAVALCRGPRPLSHLDSA